MDAVYAETATQDKEAGHLVDEIGIPPCPATLTRLLRETRAECPEFRRIAQLIGADAALAAAVLKFVNSPFYGLRTKAVSVQQALSLLGLVTVTQLVTGMLLRQAFATGAGPAMERYWKASMAIALIARLVCRDSGRDDMDSACTFALFRDCGMPVMLKKYPDYADILVGGAHGHGESIIELENRRYPVNHARLGAHLARSWYLPGAMCLAIMRHHEMLQSAAAREYADGGTRALVAIGLVSEQMYCEANGTGAPEWPLAGAWAVQELELDEARLAEIGRRVSASINQH